MDVEPLLRAALEQQGIQVVPQYEKTTMFRGRQDAVYGQLILEYERPGVLASERGTDHTAAQLQRYMEENARASGLDAAAALRRLVGVGLDGEQLFFFRYWPTPLPRSRQRARALSLFPATIAPGGYQLLGPFPVDEHSLRELFTYFRSLIRDPLRADRLAQVFGPNTIVANQAVGALYSALTGPVPPGVDTFRRQWEFTFGVVYGEDTGAADKDVPELAAAYDLPAASSLRATLFAVHTYFALLMKLLAAELLSLQSGSMTPGFVAALAPVSDSVLHDQLHDLEGGGVFHRLGVLNFLEGDFFRWYLECWSPSMAAAVRTMASALSRFEPATPRLTPEHTRDLLKRLYQYLVPRKLRHDLGEYYTPDWLAERLLVQLGYDGNPDKRLLDPACGSGTFLTLAVSRARTFLERELLDRDPAVLAEKVQKILENVVGFDLNPLAVIAARTNYLLALGDLLRVKRPVHIPIYLCDSILTPIQQHTAQRAGQAVPLSVWEQVPHFRLPSSVGPFLVPEAVVTEGHLGTLTSILEECIKGKYSTHEFMDRVTREMGQLSKHSQKMIEYLYAKLCDLEAQRRNGIWARLLRNSFAPVLQGKFDYVAGNPPWVNWESLAEEWRDASEELWERYGLFTLHGHAARLGGGKKDLAMLFVYVSVDSYLKPGGRLGFVITRTLLKTKGAGDGFRRFQVKDSPVYLKVETVEDMTDLQPFEGATNQTAILIVRRSDSPTSYPVPYSVWRKVVRGQLEQGLALEDVVRKTQRRSWHARPVDGNFTSPWLTADRWTLRALEKVCGKSHYRGYAGSTTWLNGVYWVRVLERRPDGLVVVENLSGVGKIKVPCVQVIMEPDLLYPLIRGRDVERWVATPSAHIILAQDPDARVGWPERRMKVEWPHTYAYLQGFESQLRRRSGFRQYFDPERDPYWSLYNVSRHSLSPFKVMWRETANRFVAGVAAAGHGDDRPAIPDHTVIFVRLTTPEEMHYLAAVLNSAPARALVEGYITLHPSPHVLEFLNIPAFDVGNADHAALAALGAAAARARSLGRSTVGLEADVDERAAALWGLSARELRSIHDGLKSGRRQSADGTQAADSE